MWCFIAFVLGMITGSVGLLFFIALCLVGDSRHWRDK